MKTSILLFISACSILLTGCISLGGHHDRYDERPGYRHDGCDRGKDRNCDGYRDRR